MPAQITRKSAPTVKPSSKAKTKATKATSKLRETDLYAPVKALFEGQGYTVKGEVGAADLVAMRDEEPPVIVELKTGFSLSLFHQACDRLTLTASVYIAVPRLTGRRFYKSLLANKRLARRLGIGLITVRLRDNLVEVHCDPGPYTPRKAIRKTAGLLREFTRREGDPNMGGATRQGLVTAYRQDALRCLLALSQVGQSRPAIIARATGVEQAQRIMADNHYGWFIRVRRGVYALAPAALKAMGEHAEQIEILRPSIQEIMEQVGE